MKVALINTKQSGGGAAVAARSLHKTLRAEGVDATLIVAEGDGGEATVVLSKTLWGKPTCSRHRWPHGVRNRLDMFSTSSSPATARDARAV